MKVLIFSFLFVVVTLSFPAQDTDGLLQTNLQLKKITFWPGHYYNYTCDECHRMVTATEDFCKYNSHEVNGKEEDFSPFCVGFVNYVSKDAPKLIEEKCSLFHLFVQELYCPNDPCSQITAVAYNAPNAICGLLKCNEKVVAASPSSSPQPNIASEPLTCIRYVDEISRYCELLRENKTKESSAFGCDNFAPKYEREGCDIVREKLKQSFGNSNICSNLDCMTVNITHSQLCSEIIGFPAAERVVVNEYNLWKLMSVGKAAVLPQHVPYGINITESTYAYGCKGNLNNYLNASQEECQKKTKCELKHPKFSKLEETINAVVVGGEEKKCLKEFHISYKCSENGKVHNIYTPENPSESTLSIVCTDQIPNAGPVVRDTLDHYILSKEGHLVLKDNTFDKRAQK